MSVYTVWKFHDFSITQILHEINFGDSRSAKTAVFGFFRVCQFCPFGKNKDLKSAKIHEIHNLEPLNVLKCQILHV